MNSPLYATAWGAELHRSSCLCPPGTAERLRESQGGHMCVHGTGALWLRYTDQWWRVHCTAAHLARQWLEMCEDWADVEDALVVEEWPGGQ